ncbi:MAG: SH3 domain-containing protein [Aggregatilineales bacterium]
MLFRSSRGRALIAALIVAGVLSGCGFNAPPPIPTKILVIPTSTLAPILTATGRFTATPFPSDTLIPSLTVSPTESLPAPTDTLMPSPTPTVTVMAVVRTDSGQVNVRTGPGTTYKKVGTLIAGNQIQVLFISTDGKWTLVQLDDGSQGWVLSTLVTLLNPSATVPALTTPELTQYAQLSTAISLTSTALSPNTPVGLTADANAPTHVPAIKFATDVLAYCDNPGSDAVRNKKFADGSQVFVFWSWIAQTPEQIKDQLDNAQYEVTVDGLLIGDWARYASPVKQLSDGSYIVYWFVPLGKPAAGTHHIVFRLTWKQAITDGKVQFGPGSTNPTNTGTCSFTVGSGRATPVVATPPTGIPTP